MFDFVPVYLYSSAFYITVEVLCIILCTFHLLSANNSNLLTPKSSVPTFVFCVLMTLYIGLRPMSSQFGDSFSYMFKYNHYVDPSITIDWNAEWVFASIETICKKSGLDYHGFFLVVAIGYVSGVFIACKKLIWENTWMALLFFISSFSFFTYSTNGLRNGLALSLDLVAIALLASKNSKPWVPVAALICLAGFGIHRSTAMVTLMIWIAYFMFKNVKYAVYCWFAAVFLSLVTGVFFQSLLGVFVGAYDERAAQYTTMAASSQFSRSGFRWDFILYSSVPVLLAYYVAVKRNIQDKTFNYLAITYILCNIFFVLVNRMAFSNRIAYLSWFMYPLVLGYALIRMHIWEDQDRKSAIFLAGNAAFTALMFLI